MKNLINCLILGLATCTLNAQSLTPEVVASAGETFTNGSLYVEWTLGEIMTESYAGTIVLTQGFHQPKVLLTSIEGDNPSLGTIKVYPNPTVGRISIEKETAAALQLVLMDMKGSVLASQRQSASFGELDLSHLPNGIYVLRLSDGQQAMRSIRIKKM